MRPEIPHNSIEFREDQVNLNRLIQPIRQHWIRFFLIWGVTVVISLVIILNGKPEFVSSGTLYVSDSKSSTKGSNQLSSLSDFLPDVGGGSDIETQKELIKGKDLSLHVITRIGLNTEISGNSGYLTDRPSYWQWRIARRDPSVYTQRIRVTDSIMKPDIYRAVHYRLVFEHPPSFQILGDDGFSSNGQLGRPVETKEAFFVVRYEGRKEIASGTVFDLVIEPPQFVLERFLQSLAVSGGGRVGQKNNLIHVSYKSDSPYLSKEAVGTLFNEFMTQNQSWATSVSRATLEFVDRQLEEMRIELERSSSKLTEYQKNSGLVSLEPQVQADLKRLIDYEVQLRNEQLKLFELEKLTENLKSGAPDQFLLSFSRNPLFQRLGEKLAEVGTKIATLKSQFEADYPPLKLLHSEQDALLAELKSVVNNDLNQARSSVQQLSKIVQDYKTRFKNLPEESESLTEYLRSTKVYEDVFLFLFQEKQRAKISEASTLSGIHIVDEAALPLKESAPQIRSMMMTVGMMGFFLAGASIIIPALRIRCFTSPEEIKESFAQPIFAMVPSRGKRAARATPAVIEERSQSAYAESIRLLRTNLLYAMAGKKQQTILITSAFPGDGKTSIASNLANMLIRSDRVERVLLIDADMHNPSLHGVFDLLPYPGLSNYLNGEAGLEEAIHSIPVNEHKKIDVLCAGPVPPTPVELVETDAMQTLLDYAQANYTFTVIDSSPYPLVTSAAILASRVDRILTVVRIGKTDRYIFRRHVSDLLAINGNIGFVVNMAGGETGSYGYGYGYGYNGADGYVNGVASGGDRGKAAREKRPILQRLMRKW